MGEQRGAFGSELRRLRTDAGLSLSELARRVHYTKGHLSKIENGSANPLRPFATECDRVLATGGALERLLDAEPPRTRRKGPAPLSVLPAVTAHFTGRADELDRAWRALAGEDGPGPSVCVVDGMGGVGKTTLAVRLAHRLESRFPDGCLFLDLRGYTDHAAEVTPAEALDRFLRLLGVPGEDIPADVDDRAARYRDRLRGRRVLIVLDNAHSAGQVRPMLPAEPHCRVLVTSRNRLSALDDAHHVSLDPFAEADAVALFRSVVDGADQRGADLDDADQDDTNELAARIVARCGRLPLALRIAAALFRANPAWTLADLDERLADERARLGALDDGERSVPATFHLSYRDLAADQRRLFGLLTVHPGADVDEYEAAALAGVGLPEARRLLARLHDAHLLVQLAGGRYQFHDLLRAFAVDTARLTDTERAEAMARLLDHGLHAAEAASTVIAPHRHRPELTLAHRPVAARAFADLDAALVWLAVGWPGLAALCRAAAEAGEHYRCWRLAFALRDYFFFHSKLRDPWIETHTLGAAAARALDDGFALATMLVNLGVPYVDLGDLDTAAAHYAEALALFRAAGDGHGASTALARHAWVSYHRGEPERALGDLRTALDFYEQEEPSGRNAAITRRGVARVEAELGQYALAVADGSAALEQCRALGLELDAAITLNHLGWAGYLWARAEPDEVAAGALRARAADWYGRAAELSERLGAQHELARARTGLGNLASAAGDADRARVFWASAASHGVELSPTQGEARARIAERTGA